MTMFTINIHEAKTHLSRYLEKLKSGETIILCKRNRPIAEIRSLPFHPLEKRPIGLAKDLFTVPPTFFDPLPDDIIQAFHGQS